MRKGCFLVLFGFSCFAQELPTVSWVDMAEDYSYVMVSEPSQRYFWILSHTPNLSEETLSCLLSYATYLG